MRVEGWKMDFFPPWTCEERGTAKRFPALAILAGRVVVPRRGGPPLVPCPWSCSPPPTFSTIDDTSVVYPQAIRLWLLLGCTHACSAGGMKVRLMTDVASGQGC